MITFRATTRGKTAKTAVLPGFCKMKCGDGSNGDVMAVLPAYHGGPDFETFPSFLITYKNVSG